MRSMATLVRVLVMLAPLPVTAQTVPTEKREPEVINYRLSMEKLWRIVEVQRELNALVTKEPELFKAIDREHEARVKAGNRSRSIEETAALYDRHPPIRGVLTRAGTTSRDFLAATEAMGNAMVSAEIRAGRLDSRSGPPPETAAEKANVALLQKNPAEWQKILEELNRLGDEMANMPE